MSDERLERERVLVVDDDREIGGLLVRILAAEGHPCTGVTSVEAARAEIAVKRYALVVCDWQLPGESGLDFLRELKAPETATLMVTGVGSPELADEALALGAYGYITKPFKRTEVVVGAVNALRRRRLELTSRAQRDLLEDQVAERTNELQAALATLGQAAEDLRRSQTETILRLTRAIEFRDEQTGGHIDRMSRYCELLAARVGLDSEAMRIASPMHDAGKIAVPDSILLKPGCLTGEERREMEQHARIGHLLLTGSESELLELAATIALTHHERFDGNGYPAGLQGDEIPMAGQVAAVADVFDALTSDRVYRAALPVEDAVEIMADERGKHFNPRLLDAFLGSMPEVLSIHSDRHEQSCRGDGEGHGSPGRQVRATPKLSLEQAHTTRFGHARRGRDTRFGSHSDCSENADDV